MVVWFIRRTEAKGQNEERHSTINTTTLLFDSYSEKKRRRVPVKHFVISRWHDNSYMPLPETRSAEVWGREAKNRTRQQRGFWTTCRLPWTAMLLWTMLLTVRTHDRSTTATTCHVLSVLQWTPATSYCARCDVINYKYCKNAFAGSGRIHGRMRAASTLATNKPS